MEMHLPSGTPYTIKANYDNALPKCLPRINGTAKELVSREVCLWAH